jgi:hypothetical protein
MGSGGDDTSGSAGGSSSGVGGAGSGGSGGVSGGVGGNLGEVECSALRTQLTPALRLLQACDIEAPAGSQCGEVVLDECACSQPINDADSPGARAFAALAVEVRARCSPTCAASQCAVVSDPYCFDVPDLGPFCAP